MNRSIAVKDEVYQVLKKRARENYRGISNQLELEIMQCGISKANFEKELVSQNAQQLVMVGGKL